MLSNRKLARTISDLGFYEFRRQLEYKSARRGGKVVIIDRWFPSSKKCSVCGSVNKDLKLSDRSWECSACESLHDRDVNAAINILDNAVSLTVSACGEESSGSVCIDGVKRSSMKQELNAIAT